MNDRTATLGDGRQLGYSEAGALDGRPLVFFPGMPGSRLYGRMLEPAASELGVRVLTLDIPGVGRSDFRPGRSFADTAADVTELAAQLGIDRFDLLGAAGGTPHALACAVHCADRVAGVAIVDAERAPEARTGEVQPAGAQRLLRWAATTPWANRRVMGLVARGARRSPGFILKQMERGAPPADLALLATPRVRDLITEAAADAFGPGAKGPAHEMALASQPWRIPVADIETPVALWEAERHPRGSAGTAWLAGALPRSTTTVVPDAGALWLFDDGIRVLQDLSRSD